MTYMCDMCVPTHVCVMCVLNYHMYVCMYVYVCLDNTCNYYIVLIIDLRQFDNGSSFAAARTVRPGHLPTQSLRTPLSASTQVARHEHTCACMYVRMYVRKHVCMDWDGLG